MQIINLLCQGYPKNFILFYAIYELPGVVLWNERMIWSPLTMRPETVDRGQNYKL